MLPDRPATVDRADCPSRVEVSTRGTGTPVLVLHGSPGGIDAAEVMSRFLPDDAFRSVHVSRPGYLGTPLDPEHASIDDEADLLVRVLDDLGIDRVGLLAWSGGTPVAYRLAARHPDRVRAVVAASGISSAWEARPAHLAERVVSHTTIGAGIVRWLAAHAPDPTVHGAMTGLSSLRGRALRDHVTEVLADPVRRAFVLDVAATGNSSGRHRPGWDNDVRNFAAIESLGLGDVAAPVLLVHGDADPEVTVSHSEHALEALPDASLVRLPGGTHFAFWDHRDSAALQDRVRGFLAE